jgi:Tol biopolymer transport system component
VCLCTVAGGREAGAQHFGRNKVEYVDFDFRIFETEHFAVYHYPSEEAAARMMARLAERWYARFSRLLGHALTTRQPLILYGSQPEFAQTNVVGGFLGEGIGGVTESAKRRIVMPFAPTLAETDHVLGHEIAHAFQFDMSGRGGALTWPLWAVEGMAQYLSLGATDADAVMWLRDAVQSDLLPQTERDAARRFSPYRYGHAVWAYLAGRFGDQVMGQVLRSRAGGLARRVREVTGVELKQLYAEWRSDSHKHFDAGPRRSAEEEGPSRPRRADRGRVTLGPALSPDGRQAIFFSERDRLSLDLFLADAATGRVRRKLATTSATARFESLQAIRSAGSWSADGQRFVFAAIERGQPSLVLLDMTARGGQRRIAFPQIGQMLTPSWSPDGRSIAFSALEGGVTDLYVYDLETGELRRLTRDAFADLQPAWSPDGRQIAFATDRFSSDLSSLSFGPCELAVLDVASGAVRALRAIAGAKHLNPQWSRAGDSVFFLSDPGGVTNVYRVALASGAVYQVTDVDGGVTGLAPTSPALSVARDADALVYTAYRSGRYEMQLHRGAGRLAGRPMIERPSMAAVILPPIGRAESATEELLDDSAFGLPDPGVLEPRAYAPHLFLESIGQPYVSSGGGPFGTFVRGGASLLFSDLLGERKLSMFAQAGNRLRDLALGLRFLNRERRWNWGAVADLEPSIRRLPRRRVDEQDGEPTLVRETHYFERIQFRLAGVLAYPLNHAQRFEFDGGVRHAGYRRSLQSSVLSLSTGRILERTTETAPGGAPATLGEASAAFVGDTAVFGPASPILGSRYRFEVTSTFGDLSVTRVLLDHRRYVMPVKPYTIATRVMHLGQYGPDADDPRLLPTFLGSRQFVRGYGWSSLRCRAVEGECAALEDLLGSRVLVGNMEVRFPIMGIRSRDLRYGALPAEGFLFADSGVVWSRSPAFTTARRDRRFVSSFGAGVRVNAFGLPLELAAMRALDAPARGWSFDFSFRPGF